MSTLIEFLKLHPGVKTRDAMSTCIEFPDHPQIPAYGQAAGVARTALESIGQLSDFNKFRIEHSFKVKVPPRTPDSH